ncbi:hypothetical protein E2C01_054693 [Portunus trituberculatus]|uniref:Uncharacterized protein n=1 Tax=Portunus trituberculatus TaxID=210409 RepID=A0A5B7GSN5_PORTR|nr:hypothetical protein [Portunus trituberculatus]
MKQCSFLEESGNSLAVNEAVVGGESQVISLPQGLWRRAAVAVTPTHSPSASSSRRHTAIEEEGDEAERGGLGGAGGKRHHQHPAASFRDELASHDPGYFRKDSRPPEERPSGDPATLGVRPAVTPTSNTPGSPNTSGSLDTASTASTARTPDTPSPGGSRPSVNGHSGSSDKSWSDADAKTTDKSRDDNLADSVARLAISPASQGGSGASVGGETTPATEPKTVASSGEAQKGVAVNPVPQPAAEVSVNDSLDEFPTTIAISTPTSSGWSITEHKPSRSVCEELRMLSRVNSMVERGSLATIRANSVDENGPCAPPKGTAAPGQGVGTRRGTHIARLIQSKSVNMGERPIYPNVPFSPYGSPCSSPRLRRRPLKESRCVSIEKNGEYEQLNQYKLKEAIGQVSTRTLMLVAPLSSLPPLLPSSPLHPRPLSCLSITLHFTATRPTQRGTHRAGSHLPSSASVFSAPRGIAKTRTTALTKRSPRCGPIAALLMLDYEGCVCVCVFHCLICCSL